MHEVDSLVTSAALQADGGCKVTHLACLSVLFPVTESIAKSRYLLLSLVVSLAKVRSLDSGLPHCQSTDCPISCPWVHRDLRVVKPLLGNLEMSRLSNSLTTRSAKSRSELHLSLVKVDYRLLAHARILMDTYVKFGQGCPSISPARPYLDLEMNQPPRL